MPRLPPSGRLDHVLWLGGSACSGKSSVAALLAAHHGLAVYSCDDAFEDHRRRAAGRAAFQALAGAPPERLFAPPAARRAEELAAFYRQAFPLVADDLAALAARPAAGTSPVLAEGAGLLPALVAAATGRPRAVFLVAADAFRRRHARARPATAGLLAGCPDPAAAWEVWMERDRLLGERIAAAARRLGLPVVEVDGADALAATAHRVAALLGLEPPRHAASAALSSSG